MFAFSYLLPLSNYLQCPVSCQVFIIHFTIKYTQLRKPTKKLHLLSALEL